MRFIEALAFFAVALTIYALINIYIFIRGWQAVPPHLGPRIYYTVVFLLLAGGYIAGRMIEKTYISVASDIFMWMGSLWLAAFIYFFIAALAVDLLRLANYVRPFFPEAVTADYPRAKAITAAAATLAVTALVGYGFLNANWTRVHTIDISIPKKAGSIDTINLVVATDIHLGTLVGRSKFDKIVERINAFDPDVVFLVGDVVDEDLAPVIRENAGESLRNIKSRYGVIAVTGNHEYIGGVDAASAYLREHGVTLLRDEVTMVNDSFYVVGREDSFKNRMTGVRRKDLSELMRRVDARYPVVVLDHQPVSIDESAAAGADLHISGHTHNGQLWPINYFVRAVYKFRYGRKRVGNTEVYVSSGVGTWGPPVRIGSTPEIVRVRLHMRP